MDMVFHEIVDQRRHSQ